MVAVIDTEQREDLEDLAESDLPAADVAQALLEVAEETGE